MYFTQIDEIIAGTKTQTRRIVKPGENEWVKSFTPPIEVSTVLTPTHRIKWQVGRDYAVSPGRGKPGVWWKPGGSTYYTRHDGVWIPSMWKGGQEVPEYLLEDLENMGLQPLRIVITAIRREPLQSISEEDAIAEGCTVWRGGAVVGFGEVYEVPGYTAIEAYHDLWDCINTRPGTRWDDNPDVWVIEFNIKH